MVTYLELGSEPVWGAQSVPVNMTELFIKPLRAFYGLGPALIGAPGDNNHLRGRHRSRDWDLTSAYCTNRAYATKDARDKAGSGSWYRAVDIGITGETLYAASRRMDALVRSGADGGKVAEWFGTFDGQTVVGWFQGHPASSDSSHLYHLHVGVWTQWANDAALMALLYDTISGADMTPDQAATLTRIDGRVTTMMYDLPANQWQGNETNALHAHLVGIDTRINACLKAIAEISSGNADVVAIIAAMNKALDEQQAELEAAIAAAGAEARDAVGDLAEGGAAAVRADA